MDESTQNSVNLGLNRFELKKNKRKRKSNCPSKNQNYSTLNYYFFFIFLSIYYYFNLKKYESWVATRVLSQVKTQIKYYNYRGTQIRWGIEIKAMPLINAYLGYFFPRTTFVL
jgi:hypothetical protein